LSQTNLKGKESQMDTKTLLKVSNERSLEALTGVNEKQLEIITKNYEEKREAKQANEYEAAVGRGERVRRPGGRRKGVLERSVDVVMFAWFYLKTDPTFAVLGSMQPFPRRYLVDDHQQRIAVQLDIQTFEKIEELLENYALVQFMRQEEDAEELLELAQAQAYYQTLPKAP
jgi:hypothetical protein